MSREPARATAAGPAAETGSALPVPPEQPVPGECCGRGCVNCVWVYYERALERWKQRCAEIESGRGPGA